MSRLVARHRAAAKLIANFGGEGDGKVDIIGVLQFVESAYELAFGDGAIDKGYSPEEVLATLSGHSDKALSFDEGDESPAMRR